MIGKRILLGVASVWDKRKGLDDIVKLSGITDDQIIAVGVSEEQKQALPSKILAYTRTNNVNELRKLYSVSDVFINPTYEDNFPTTNIEALACGTPVITYDTGGSLEAAEDKAGAVVRKGNLEQFIHTCQMLSARPLVCQDRSHLFTVEKMTKNYIPLY